MTRAQGPGCSAAHVAGGRARRGPLRTARLVGAVGLLAAAPGVAPRRAVAGAQRAAAAASYVPLVEGDTTPPRARGVWRARGYATTLAVGARDVQAYRTAGAACWPDPRPGAAVRADYGYVAAASLDGSAQRPNTLTLASWPGDTRYVFDRLPALPPACAPASGAASAWTPPRLLRALTDLVGEQYAFFGVRGVDWPARVRAARRGVSAASDDAALYRAMTGALAGLGDAHVGLDAVVGGDSVTWEEEASPTLAAVARGARPGDAPGAAERRWRAAYRDGILDSVLAGRGHLDANRRIFWGTIGGGAGGVGYLNLVTMGGFTPATASGADADLGAELAALDSVLDRAVASFAGARAVIVDVTNNRGGYDAVGRAVAARFADRPRVAYTKQARGARGVPPQAFVVAPAAGPRYLGPVALLTSDVTVSAGETFALAMRAFPAVRHAGARTRGAFSDVLAAPLPNGWTVRLSNEVYRDPAGRAVEAAGVVPREPLAVFPPGDLAGGHARAVRALAARLRVRAPRG